MKLVLSLIAFIVCFGLNGQTYKDSILQLRQDHLNELMDSTAGVLNSEEIQHFKGTSYFDVNEEMIIHATFKKKKGKKFKMPTSTERTPIYRRYGYLNFELDGRMNQLTVYQNMELKDREGFEDYLFVPFRDATSGITTYGGGRYLDFKIPSSNEVLIDFNLTYNPYCAYSIRYSCPVPPTSNTLVVQILAGEKTPIGH